MMRQRMKKGFTFLMRQPALAVLLEHTLLWFAIGMVLGTLATCLLPFRFSVIGCASLFALLPGFCGAYLLLLRREE